MENRRPHIPRHSVPASSGDAPAQQRDTTDPAQYPWHSSTTLSIFAHQLRLMPLALQLREKICHDGALADGSTAIKVNSLQILTSKFTLYIISLLRSV